MLFATFLGVLKLLFARVASVGSLVKCKLVYKEMEIGQSGLWLESKEALKEIALGSEAFSLLNVNLPVESVKSLQSVCQHGWFTCLCCISRCASDSVIKNAHVIINVIINADPYEDQFAKRQKAKKEAVAKNELQRLRNIARNMKGKGT